MMRTMSLVGVMQFALAASGAQSDAQNATTFAYTVRQLLIHFQTQPQTNRHYSMVTLSMLMDRQYEGHPMRLQTP